MARIDPMAPADMSAEQKRLAEEIAAPRGGKLGGPFAIWLRNPDMVDRANKFGSFLRTGTSLPRRQVELAVLVTARFWTAQYEWHVHEDAALEAGVPADAVAAIKQGRTPPLTDPADRAIYALCTELYEAKVLSDAAYEAALAALGETGVVEIVAVAGFYSMVALTLNAFQVDIPGGAPPPLAPLS